MSNRRRQSVAGPFFLGISLAIIVGAVVLWTWGVVAAILAAPH